MKFGPERCVLLLSALEAVLLYPVGYVDNHNVESKTEGVVCGTKDDTDTDSYSTSLVGPQTTTKSPYKQLPKRMAPGFSSNDNVLWRITKYPEVYNDHTTAESLESAVGEAFHLWSSVCNLNFYHYLFSPAFHVEIKFEIPVSHNEYCRQSFELNEFGHYMKWRKNPVQIHMNANTRWTTNKTDDNIFAANLIFVLAHEIGHAMGFGHNNLTDSVMFEHYFNSDETVALSSDDVTAAVRRYGYKWGSWSHRVADEHVVTGQPSILESFRELPGDLKLLWKGVKVIFAKIMKKTD